MVIDPVVRWSPSSGVGEGLRLGKNASLWVEAAALDRAGAGAPRPVDPDAVGGNLLEDRNFRLAGEVLPHVGSEEGVLRGERGVLQNAEKADLPAWWSG